MKAKLLPILMLTVACIYASEIPDISRFRDLTALKNSESLMFENFDGKLSDWILGRSCKLIKNAGMTGTNALLCERTNPKDYNSAVARYKLKVHPNRFYKVSIMYRTEGVPANTRINSPSIELHKNGKYNKMINPLVSIPRASSKWKKVEMQFKAGAENYLILRLFYNITGKIWWDNLKIEEIGSNRGIVYPIRPHGLMLDAAGNVTLKAYVWETAPCKLQNHAVLVDLAGKKKLLEIDKNGNAVGKLGSLASGTYEGQAFLLDLKGKRIIAKDKFTFYRNISAPPKGLTTLDQYGRLLVDGKPFLPVGIYVTWIRTEEDVKRIADGGFNFILTYTAHSMNIQKEKNKISKISYPGLPPHFKSEEWKKQIINSLDILQKHNLKLMGFRNMDEYRHPVLLAAYISDEYPVTDVPKLRKVREKFAKKFPYYPVVGLTDKPEDYIPYGKAVDVLGIDVYPILYKEKPQTMITLRSSLTEAVKAGVPIMFVPQTFNWGAHRSDAPYKKFKYPSTEEMRSMVLLPAIYGVKWFCFYSYTTIMERQEKKDPGSSKMFWPRVVAVAKVLRELEPWLLSLDSAPEVKVINKAKSIVDAKAFSANGKLQVIITACGPDKAEAEIIVPGKNNLKSKYGHTKAIGNGKYIFSGNNITSDILEE